MYVIERRLKFEVRPKAWPYVSAGIAVWDTLAPKGSSLIAHDGNEAL